MRTSQIEWAGRVFGPAIKSIKFAAALLLCAVAASTAQAGTDNRAPDDVPPQIAVSSLTNKVSFHGFGVGFQIYTWDGTSWGHVVPDATLFDDEGNVVATHFATSLPDCQCPTWQSNSGSKVIGKLPPAQVIVDTDSIPWVRLEDKITEGPGVFADTTFIQRVHTVGGKAPKDPGTFIGQKAPVAYTADYFFYRAATDTTK